MPTKEEEKTTLIEQLKALAIRIPLEKQSKKIIALIEKINLLPSNTTDSIPSIIADLYTAVISIDKTDPNQVPDDTTFDHLIAIKAKVVELANNEGFLETSLSAKLTSWKKDSSDGFFATRPTKFTDEIDPKVDALRQAMKSENDYLVKIRIWELKTSLIESKDSLKQESKARQEAFYALKQLVTDTAQKFEKIKPTAVDELFVELNNWPQASYVYGSIRPAVFKNIDVKIKRLQSVIKSNDKEQIITYASLLLADVQEIERNSLVSKREIACRKLEDALQNTLSELISLPSVNSDTNKVSDTVSVERSPLLKKFDRLAQVSIQSKALKSLREITKTWGKGLNIFQRIFGIKRSDFFTTKILQRIFGIKQRPDIFAQSIIYTHENQTKSESIDGLIEQINKAFEKENFGAIQSSIAQLIPAIEIKSEGDPTSSKYAAESKKLDKLLKLCKDVISPSIPDSSPRIEESAAPQQPADEQASVSQPASLPKIEPDSAEQPKPAKETTPEPQHVCPDVKVVASSPDSSPKKEEVSAEQQSADEQASVPQPAPSPMIEPSTPAERPEPAKELTSEQDSSLIVSSSNPHIVSPAPLFQAVSLDITSNVPAEQSPVSIKKPTCKQGSYTALTVCPPPLTVCPPPPTILKTNTPGPSFFKGSPPPSAPPSPNLQALSKEMPACTLVLKKGSPPNQQEPSKENLDHQAATFSATSS